MFQKKSSKISLRHFRYKSPDVTRNFKLNEYVNTIAGDPISRVPRMTSAGEWSFGVGAVGVSVTVVNNCATLLNIWTKQKSKCQLCALLWHSDNENDPFERCLVVLHVFSSSVWHHVQSGSGACAEWARVKKTLMFAVTVVSNNNSAFTLIHSAYVYRWVHQVSV